MTTAEQAWSQETFTRIAVGWLGAAVAGLVSMGCAGPSLTLVKEPAQRIDARGFSGRLLWAATGTS